MLRPRKRITKKQLKEDKLVTFYFKATSWIERNSKYIYMGLGAVVLVVLLLYVNARSKRTSESNASVELLRATRAYESGNYQNAITQLSNLVENYGGTRSGTLSLLYLANSFYQTGDIENAKKNYQKFASEFSGDEHLLASAIGGVAACLEQEKKYLEAAEQYERIVRKYPKTVQAPYFLLRAGRCFALADDTSKAREQYEKIVKEYPNAQEKDQALMLMAMIKT